jgi:hypothetical protein
MDPLDIPDAIERGAFDDLLVNIETACRNRRAELTESGVAIEWEGGNVISVRISPDDLRQIADDIEREGADYCRTVEAEDGSLVDIVTAD